MRGVIRLLLLACGLVLVGALPAWAAPTWSAPQSLSGAGATAGNSPSVAIADGGLGVEAWSETVAGVSVIRAAQHVPGGGWASFAGSLSSSLPGFACNPFTSIDPAGNALVVWTQWNSTTSCFDGNQTLVFATHAAGASGWSAPNVIGTTGAPGNPITTAAVNASGQMIVAWGMSNGTSTLVFAAIGSPTGGFGAAPTLLTAPIADGVYYLAAGIGQSGDAAVQWEHYVTGGTGNIQISVRPRGGAFPVTPVALTANISPASAYNSSVALDAAGDVLAAYTQNTGSVASDVTQRLAAGNTTPQPAQATGLAGSDWISVGFDAAGNATAVGLSEDFTPTPHQGSLSQATRAAGVGSTWVGGNAVTDVLPGPYDQPRLLVNGSGAALVSWQIANSQNSVQALYRPAGGSFGSLTTVGAGTAEAAALAPSGDAAFAFNGPNTPLDARVSVLDVTPPAITAVSVPATATAGQPVAMSVTASDAWSGLAAGQPSWTFADGGTASGLAVTHTYAKAGTYTVGVTALDGAGLAAAPVTRQIVVSDAPVPPPPITTVAKPVVKATWKASRLSGSVTISGTVGITTKVTVSLRRHGAAKYVAVNTFATIAGKWKRTLRLAPTLVPGRYDVFVTGAGVVSSTTSFTLAAPKSGIATRVYASGLRHGPAVTRLGSTSELWAHFGFGTLPAKGQKLTTQWTLPGGKKLAANSRPRTRLVEAQVKDLGGKPLPKGRWHCVLKAGKVVVATVNVRLS